MKKEIDEAVGNINGRFRSEKWTPVMYFSRKMTQQSLLSYYKAADISLLTPLRDGMNLIAKEYTASNDNDGVLILSEFAGAAEELQEALLVNPFNIQETAEVIKTAIEMPKEEKQQRFQSLKKKVKEPIVFKTSDEISKGFTISFDGGKSSFDFTDESLAQYLGRFLNSQVAQLVKDSL